MSSTFAVMLVTALHYFSYGGKDTSGLNKDKEISQGPPEMISCIEKMLLGLELTALCGLAGLAGIRMPALRGRGCEGRRGPALNWALQ